MARKNVVLPEEGVSRGQIMEELRALRSMDYKWEEGRIFGLVYNAGEEHNRILEEAHNMFFHENAISPIAFPSLAKLEAEVVSMAVDLFGGDKRAVGTMTSGGTESLLMAVKTYRDYFREKKPEITKPEIVIPETAHVSFRKAAHYFGVRLVETPVDKNYQADLEAITAALSENTILLVGSAYNYPKGVLDPVEDMAALAKERGIGMHVDGCLGGFVLEFLKILGHEIPPFDFGVPGVTSISADLHKYGFTAKGAALIMYRNQRFLNKQFFANTRWSGGIYISPSMAGSRPGAIIAAAWAGMQALGRQGYTRVIKGLKETTDALMAGIESIPELYVMGHPLGTVFAFSSREIDVFVLGEEMEKRGWELNYMQNPTCLHLMITNIEHAKIVPEFLNDLTDAVGEVKAHPERKPAGTAAIYGMAATMPKDKKASLKRVALGFLADQYRV